MLFSSFQFIFIFLPVVYVGFLIAHRLGGWAAATRLLAVASLGFYAMWGVPLLSILLGSLLFNFAAGYGISRLGEKPRLAKYALLGSIAANLGLITLDAYRVGAHEQLRSA